jgi:hypothetical protein
VFINLIGSFLPQVIIIYTFQLIPFFNLYLRFALFYFIFFFFSFVRPGLVSEPPR